MKQNNIIKLVLLLLLYSVFTNAKTNWAPIVMGDITTFAPYAKTNTPQAKNTISSIEASHSESYLHLKMNGSFMKGSHGSFFIDADNDAQTGYSNSPVKGAEYLVDDNALYRYPDDAKDWEWDKISPDVSTEKTSTTITSKIPLNMMDTMHTIKYIAGVATSDWKERSKYNHMEAYVLNENVPAVAKIFVIGDSTVHNNELYHPGQKGWADKKALGSYMKEDSNLYNKAKYGASSKSYKEKKWESTKKSINENKDNTKGAYLLIQFGHNDRWPQPNSITKPGRGKSFYIQLKEYVTWAKENYVKPVLITPVQERVRKEKRELLAKYAETMRFLAEDEGVTLLDLEKKSLVEYAKYGNIEAQHKKVSGMKNAKEYDITHFSAKGAEIVAGWVKELICDSNEEKLCEQFK